MSNPLKRSRSRSLEVEQPVKRSQTDHDSQAASNLEVALQISREVEPDAHVKLLKMINSGAPSDEVEAFYAPFFAKLANVLVGTNTIPVPPAGSYAGDMVHVMHPENEILGFDRLIDYIIQKHNQTFQCGPIDVSDRLDAVEKAWIREYIGNSHKLLHRAIAQMYSDSGHKPYANFCSIIQGSGTGKSRLVDKLAESVFTIPIVLRPEVDKSGFPRGDIANNRSLVEFFWSFKTSGSALRVERYYLMFLLKTIAYADRWIDKWMNESRRPEDIAAEWRKYLGLPRSPERLEMYTQAVDPSPLEGFEHILDTNVSDGIVEHHVRQYIASVSAKLKSEEGPVILFYIDEAHHLTKVRVTADLEEPLHTAYQCVCKAFNHMRNVPVFALFISTYLRLSEISPHVRDFWSWSSLTPPLESNYNINPPFVELPFDVWREPWLVDEGAHTANEMCSLEFMIRFGRPLFWTLLEGRKGALNNVMQLAISKLELRFDDSILGKKFNYPVQELISSLAIRVDLTFALNRSKAVSLEELLVASSLRTVYSVPQHREYLRAGYPTEPFVAEAASRTIFNHCRVAALGNEVLERTSTAVDKVIAKYKYDIPSAISQWFDEGLIEKGNRGELVAKILITLAHDIAVLETPSFVGEYLGRRVSFSHMIPVVNFLRALISEEHIDKVLNARPHDGSKTTLMEAFKDYYVHFTHFTKAGDKFAFTDDAGYCCISRAAAVQGYGDMDPTDLLTPCIRIPPGSEHRPNRWSMSGIFWQVKDCIDEPFVFIDAQKTFEFFTPSTEEAANQRPYITIVMELGVLAQNRKPNVGRKSTVKRGSKKKGKQPQTVMPATSQRKSGHLDSSAKGKERQTTMSEQSPEQSPGQLSPDRVEVIFPDHPLNPRSVKKSGSHPRYQIKIIGCSERVYNVVGDFPYSGLLANKDMLAEHPRKGKEYRKAIMQMKPYFVRETYD